MNTTNQPLTKALVLLTLLIPFTLSACRGVAFSATDTAVNAIRSNIDSNATLVDDSLQVHQKVEINDHLDVVVMSYQQLHAGANLETCIYTYQVVRRAFGWWPKSGGGGCWSVLDESAEDIQIGAGQSSSSEPGDLGFSEVYGLVNNPEIINVKVAWNDDTVDEVDVTNSTFVSWRHGLFEMKTIAGLNEQGDVLYTFAPEIAPGKQP